MTHAAGRKRAELRLDCGICGLVFGALLSLVGILGGTWWPTVLVGVFGFVLLLIGVTCVAPPDVHAERPRDEPSGARPTESADGKPSIGRPT